MAPWHFSFTNTEVWLGNLAYLFATLFCNVYSHLTQYHCWYAYLSLFVLHYLHLLILIRVFVNCFNGDETMQEIKVFVVCLTDVKCFAFDLHEGTELNYWIGGSCSLHNCMLREYWLHVPSTWRHRAKLKQKSWLRAGQTKNKQSFHLITQEFCWSATLFTFGHRFTSLGLISQEQSLQ